MAAQAKLSVCWYISREMPMIARVNLILKWLRADIIYVFGKFIIVESLIFTLNIIIIYLNENTCLIVS